MRPSTRTWGLALAALAACSPVAKSDADFWEPSDDVGGTRVDFSSGASGGAGAGAGAGGPSVPGGGGQIVGGTGGAGSGGATTVGAGGVTSTGAGGESLSPSAGGSGPGGVGAGGTATSGNSCAFTFTVTTVTARGRFAPRNVGALWIQDASGRFQKSLEVWGKQRLPNLTAWTAASGSNTVDAVTSATLTNHRQHVGHWDCTDISHQVVPNGGYQACVSFAEDDAIPFFGPAPHVACAPFHKGAGPESVSPPDAANFVGWQLVVQ